MERRLLKSNYRWILKRADEEKVRALTDALHISTLTARLLVLRGIDRPNKADIFLHTEKAQFHDPMKMLGMKEAAERIIRAVRDQEVIRVFGDYDADGVTSTALLIRALRKMGARVTSYIPNRFKDGYGPNVRAVEKAEEDRVGLIVTVDSGIAALEAASRARELGIDYIVTDHHEPPAVLPNAFAILNPKQPECDYPFKGLSGAGVALKLVQAICPDQLNDGWIALASVGTVADLVPMRDENRLIVSKGLRAMDGGSLAGIDALKIKAGISGTMDSDMIGFQLAPRLNAAGRLADADAALCLLLADSAGEAAPLADRLEELNRQRKALADKIMIEADKEASGYYRRGDKALVLAGKNWHQGVIGIVASRIVEKYYRPTIILSIDEQSGAAKGSGRSIDGFNLYRGLERSSEHLTQFGGHQMAAGLSLPEEEIDAFREDFNLAAAESLDDQAFVPRLAVDGECTPDQITVDQIEELDKMAPFGTDNPRPTFRMDTVRLSRISAAGREKAHLKVTFQGREKELDGIGFGLGGRLEQISPIDCPTVIGNCSINEWNGFRKPQFLIEDLCIDGPQIFDWRSEQRIREKISALPSESATLLAFHPESAERLRIGNSVTLFEPGMSVSRPSLVLLDLPEQEDQLSELTVNSPRVHRVYAVFYHQREHYFSSFPSRNHFVWYYALIRQEHSFMLDAMAPKIARYKGWPERTIHFMTKVFFELGFVKIEKGLLTENSAPVKAPLTASLTYRKEKKQLELEDLFCYSPLSSLKTWFEKQMKYRDKATEPEGTMNGL